MTSGKTNRHVHVRTRARARELNPPGSKTIDAPAHARRILCRARSWCLVLLLLVAPGSEAMIDGAGKDALARGPVPPLPLLAPNAQPLLYFGDVQEWKKMWAVVERINSTILALLIYSDCNRGSLKLVRSSQPAGTACHARTAVGCLPAWQMSYVCVVPAGAGWGVRYAGTSGAAQHKACGAAVCRLPSAPRRALHSIQHT